MSTTRAAQRQKLAELCERIFDALQAKPEGWLSTELGMHFGITSRLIYPKLCVMERQGRIHHVGVGARALWFAGAAPTVPVEYLQAQSIWQVGWRCLHSIGPGRQGRSWA